MIYINLIEKHNINKASFIHLASFYEKEAFLSLGFKAPIIIVPRGLDPGDYVKTFDREWLIKRYPALEGKKIILFLGRIHPKKGFDLLAWAFKEVIEKKKDVYLLIVGPGENRYVEKVKRMFEKVGISERVIFTGMLLGHEKLSVFNSSDIFILPSYVENFGIAALEAMACGLPLVITNRVGLYPDVEEYKAGIITECDRKEIANAVLKLLNNGDLRDVMGENGKRLARDRFSSDRIANKMIDIYQGIIKR